MRWRQFAHGWNVLLSEHAKGFGFGSRIQRVVGVAAMSQGLVLHTAMHLVEGGVA